MTNLPLSAHVVTLFVFLQNVAIAMGSFGNPSGNNSSSFQKMSPMARRTSNSHKTANMSKMSGAGDKFGLGSYGEK